MADITEQQEQQLREAFANFDQSAASAADLVGAAGTKKLFCDNWPTVKEVLRFIAGLPFVPAAVKTAIALIIKAGDTAAGILCG